VQTNSKLNQGEVIKVGILKKEKISSMPAWFKEWSDTVYQNVQPKWFISWSTEFEKHNDARFEGLEKRINDRLDNIVKLNNLKE
jgi:hypothetical protein